MDSFSQRRGLKQVKSFIQTDFIDIELKNSLWNALSATYWEHIGDYRPIGQAEFAGYLARTLWSDYFKLPMDTMGDAWYEVRGAIRQYFFTCEWYEVYDLIEFIANEDFRSPSGDKFITLCNKLLERERSAYRFIGTRIAEIASEEEVDEIEEVLQSTDSLQPVASHMKQALDLLADRKSPDYRNSIKESVSAVEAMCNLVASSPTATLGQALNTLDKEKAVDIHPALKSAFQKLYGYTSDADGIRHALLKESHLDFEDAKFMLVSCSAFINYLKAKTAKAGIEL